MYKFFSKNKLPRNNGCDNLNKYFHTYEREEEVPSEDIEPMKSEQTMIDELVEETQWVDKPYLSEVKGKSND